MTLKQALLSIIGGACGLMYTLYMMIKANTLAEFVIPAFFMYVAVDFLTDVFQSIEKGE